MPELFALIRGEGRRILAGGTDLLVQAKEGVVAEEILVDLTGVEELRGIQARDGTIRIGAAVTHAEIAESSLLRRHVPALPLAAVWIGSAQIRSRGTIGGNIVNASPAGDLLPALYACGAVVHIRSRTGRRSLPIGEFILAPRKTALRRGEIVTHVAVPKARGRALGAFVKVGARRALAISKVMVGVHAVAGRDGKIASIGIGLGAVAPTILRAREAEKILSGRAVTPEAAVEAGALAAAASRPIDDVRSTADYRRKVTAAAVERALLALTPAPYNSDKFAPLSS